MHCGPARAVSVRTTVVAAVLVAHFSQGRPPTKAGARSVDRHWRRPSFCLERRLTDGRRVGATLLTPWRHLGVPASGSTERHLRRGRLARFDGWLDWFRLRVATATVLALASTWTGPRRPSSKRMGRKGTPPVTIIEDFVSTVLRGTVTVVTKVVGTAEHLFGDDPRHSSVERTNHVLFGGGGPPSPPPAADGAPGNPPPGAGGLQDGAGHDGQSYGDNVNAAALTDEKLSELLDQIFTKNRNARDQVTAILADIQDKTKQVGPELGDPASLLSFHQYLDQKFGEIQKVLGDAQVDAKTQSAIMAALGEQYRTNAPKRPGDGEAQADGGGSGGVGTDATGQGSDGGSDGSGGDGGGGVGGGAGSEPLTDPMAGLGPLGGVDPMSMIGPAMAGLGSLPGSLGGLGGLGGGSPLDALGPALQSLGPALAGARDSFGDDKSGADDRNGRDFTDTKGDKPDKLADFTDEHGGQHGNSPGAQGNTPTTPPAPQAGPQPAPGTPVAGAPAGAPAAAASDPQRTVDMPGGTQVTAPSAERATAMRSVIGGSSVTGAYEGQDVHLPPPGTPVLAPVSRNDLQPGDYGQFSTKSPIMYMGNDKIWMDGQLQPIGALQSSSDFLGWSAPPVGGAGQQGGPAAPPAVQSGRV